MYDKQTSIRHILALTLPAMLAVVMEPMAEMVDTAILGHESTVWVASLAATNACLGSFAWLFNFLSYGVTAQIAQSFGANELGRVGKQIRAGLGLALALGLGVGICLYLAGDVILRDVMGTDAELYVHASTYYAIRVLGYPLTILSLALIGILRGLQEIRFSGLVVFLMTAFNAVGTYLSVHVFDWGIHGAAWATVLSFLCGDLLMLARLYRCRADYGLEGSFTVAWSELGALGSDGLNLAGRTGLLTLAFFLMTASAARLGTVSLAAHQVALQLWLLAAFLIDGLAITATTLGGRFVGRGDWVALAVLSRRLLALGALVGLAFTALYLLAQSMLIGIYTDQADIQSTVSGLWLLIALSQPMNALSYVFDGLLFGARAFALLRRRMSEGFLFCFLPLLAYAHSQETGLIGLWFALLALNAYRGVSGHLGLRKILKQEQAIAVA